MEAGAIGLTSPSKHNLTAGALRASGTTQIISFAFRICLTDMEMACRGTSEILANQPSPTCWRRQASSSWTMRYGSSVWKFAGGSLNARRNADDACSAAALLRDSLSSKTVTFMVVFSPWPQTYKCFVSASWKVFYITDCDCNNGFDIHGIDWRAQLLCGSLLYGCHFRYAI